MRGWPSDRRLRRRLPGWRGRSADRCRTWRAEESRVKPSWGFAPRGTDLSSTAVEGLTRVSERKHVPLEQHSQWRDRTGLPPVSSTAVTGGGDATGPQKALMTGRTLEPCPRTVHSQTRARVHCKFTTPPTAHWLACAYPADSSPPTQLQTLADAARDLGNGQMELTSRGNVQLRSVSDPEASRIANRFGRPAAVRDARASAQHPRVPTVRPYRRRRRHS